MNHQFKIFIPTYNSSSTIKQLVNRISEFGYRDKIFVIDDGSTDSSVEICKGLDISYHSFKRNQGKGRAISYILENFSNDLDFFIVMDSDLQHLPSDIDRFIDKYSENGLPVFGRRDFSSPDMPLDRRISNRISTSLANLLANHKVSDSQCGFRLYTKQSVEGIILTTSNFETETELFIKLSNKVDGIDEVDIETIYNGKGSHINRVYDIYRFVKLIIRIFILK